MEIENIGKNLLNQTDIHDLAVIGAGISGALVAQQAASAGQKVCVVDKARGSGGRLSTKRIKLEANGFEDVTSNNTILSFDLGCSDFKVTHPDLKPLVKSWQENHLIIDINGSNYQTLTRSSFLTRSLIPHIETRFATCITRIDRQGDYWWCYGEIEGVEVCLLACKILVLAMPAPQVAKLLPSGPYTLPIQSVRYEPQWVVMLTLPSQIALDELEHEIFFNGDIAQIRCESNKPERELVEGMNVWVIHFSSQWSHKYLNWPSESIQQLIKDMLSDFSVVISVYAHQWAYSRVQRALYTDSGCLEIDSQLYAVGDWLFKKGQCFSSRGVENSLLSAIRLTKKLALK